MKKITQWFSTVPKDKLINIAVFQLGWIGCVFGGDEIALPLTLVALTLHGLLFIKGGREWLLIAVFSGMGVLLDSLLIHLNVLQLTPVSGAVPSHSAFIPHWLICLWIFLSLTLCHSLQWLQGRYWLGSALGAIAGPWSYWAGSRFVEIELAQPFMSLAVLAVVWALVVPIGLKLADSLVLSVGLGQKKLSGVTAIFVTYLTLTVTPIEVNAEQPFSVAKFENQEGKNKKVVYAIGTAYDITGSKVLYREVYSHLDKDLREVHYMDTEGETVALKYIDQAYSPVSPSFVQENYWSNERTGATWEGNQLTLHFTPAMVSHGLLKTEGAYLTDVKQVGSEKKKRIDDNQVVIDAGFDHFIRNRWEELLSDKKLKYRFAVPSRLTTVSMNIQRHPCGKDKGVIENNDLLNSNDMVCFKVKPSSVFLGLFLDPVELSYHQDYKQLLRFRGLGNIADKNGKLLKVDIRYQHTGIHSAWSFESPRFPPARE